MSKYQEALNNLKELGLSIPANGQGEEFGFSQDFDFDHDGYESECSLLQELVDKETPIKYIEIYDEELSTTRNCCKKCKFEVDDIYCSNCGQKQDWSDEE